MVNKVNKLYPIQKKLTINQFFNIWRDLYKKTPDAKIPKGPLDGKPLYAEI